MSTATTSTTLGNLVETAAPVAAPRPAMLPVTGGADHRLLGGAAALAAAALWRLRTRAGEPGAS
jgi:hypothetical protein